MSKYRGPYVDGWIGVYVRGEDLQVFPADTEEELYDLLFEEVVGPILESTDLPDAPSPVGTQNSRQGVQDYWGWVKAMGLDERFYVTSMRIPLMPTGST
jgi:hypothetical protein